MTPLFDLHCDTLYEIYKKKVSFDSSSLHVSNAKIFSYNPYVQICAIWSDYRLSNDVAFQNYKNCLEYSRNVGFDFTVSKRQLLLSVEDARLLNGYLTRLDQLYDDGTVSLTLNWKGESCIGGGWNTTSPLTPFGIDVITRCCEKRIAVDLSHSSYEVQVQALNLAEHYNISPIFSHSNSYTICNHKRNLTDDIAKEIANRNGLIGLSMCCEHISNKKPATIYDVIKHASHFLSLGCGSCLALGCDFDGISALPIGISGVDDLAKLYVLFTKEFGTIVANDIFYNNSHKYFSKLLEGR